jgi:hypothetical protein
VETKYSKNYPQITLIECVSTHTMDGIKEFKKDIRKLAMQQPFIRNRIPGKHYGLAQAIVDQRKVHSPPIGTFSLPSLLLVTNSFCALLVTWEEYTEFAKLVYISDPKSLEIATRHLHELGFLMHFREESLKSIYSFY